MTRVVVQRGPAGSASNQNRSSLPGSSSAPGSQLFAPQIPSTSKEEEHEKEVKDPCALDDLPECHGSHDEKTMGNDDSLSESTSGIKNEVASNESVDMGKGGGDDDDVVDVETTANEFSRLGISETFNIDESEGSGVGCSQIISGSSYPPPPPVPPPKPSMANFNSRRTVLGGSSADRIGPSRRAVAWPVVSTRTSPSGSHPSSPRSYGEGEGYNSADEHNPCYGFSYDDAEKERQFELDIRRVKGLEVKRMVEDGNCLFRAVADQVYGDSEDYDLTRQMCIDYMERERDHFSQFTTEGFTSYCKRKRRDKVYGNNIEIQALSEIYNRPIHIYSYSTEPINIFHGSYNNPPIRLSYHHGNHYNSLVDPRRLDIGTGLGFSSLQGTNIDKDQIKAAMKAQQDQQIDNALLAEARFYSDLELTEKEIEHMVMEASRAEYLAGDRFKQQLGFRESSTSGAEPSSSGATTGPSQREQGLDSGRERALPDTVLSSNVQLVLSMGFSYLQVIEAYSIFGDDVESIVCYLLETGGGSSLHSRCKGKAAE
ncbi:hypothetical protein CKAN_01231000 [Cinnamomum micranthum f. kanehirae]|uniref:ubiquitinyl hydrolase 1 n=1 Tax=Cinnamomum micranthum f. kanehirae TaxID=337451 RepID=A0A3S3MW23_9MAGN|nr:hypothetical protein CKAN_01231000 [Cinnamomum micranthum f. kanehirae]